MQADSNHLRLGFIGCGKMASAMVRGIIPTIPASQISASARSLSSPTLKSLKDDYSDLAIFDNNQFVVDFCCADPSHFSILFFCVKPGVLPGVFEKLNFKGISDPKRHLMVTIAAGVSLSLFSQVNNSTFTNFPVSRIMPNLPIAVNESALAYTKPVHPTLNNESASFEITSTLKFLLDKLGKAVCVQEKHMDAVTGLSGSGPAFVAMFIQSLADGGVLAGLPRSTAYALALQTVKGTTLLLEKNIDSLHPEKLKDNVCSPGGTTINGVRVLERQGLRSATMEAVMTATERSAALGRKAAASKKKN
eukprot:g285.t1